MSIFLIETWVVKPEDLEIHDLLWIEYVDYMRKNLSLFAEIKSMRLFKTIQEQDVVTHAQIVEFESLAEKMNLDSRISEDKKSVEFKHKLMQVKNIETATAVLCDSFLEFY